MFRRVPRKSLLCPFFLPVLCVRAPSPGFCSSAHLLFNKPACVSPSSSRWLSSFQPPSSVPWSVGRASAWGSLCSVSGCSVPPSWCPRARFLDTHGTGHAVVSSGAFPSSLAPCAPPPGGLNKHFIKGLDSKYFKLGKPNQRYYVGTYITT